MKKVYLALLQIVLSTAIYTQEVNLEWAKSIGGQLSDDSYSINVDALGNVYVTGNYSGTVDFDPGAAIFNLTSNGDKDIFIQKLDAEGNFIWAKSMGGLLSDVGYSMTTDASGSVYLTGVFRGTADFDPGEATFNLISNGDTDVFIQKLDAEGNFIWAKSMGGIDFDYGNFITTNALGNVHVVGSYQGIADFDPGMATFNLTSNGMEDVFIQKLDAEGNFIWAKSMGGTDYDTGGSITTDASGNVVVSGVFRGTTDFDPGVAAFNLTSNGNFDVFIQKLDAGGNFIWAKSIGGSSNDIGYSSTIDALGNIAVIGTYNGTVDFDPGSGTTNLTSNGESDVFIQKLDAGGNFIWAKSIGGASDDRGFSITTDASGNIYFTGDFTGTVDFDPGAATFNLTSNGFRDIFIQKLDADGNFIWAKSIGGSMNDRLSSIATDASGNVYVTGVYLGTVDFDPSAATFNLTSNGEYDVFILKLNSSTVGLEENALLNRVSIFPNPNLGLVNIDLGNLKKVSIKVFNIDGQLMYHQENIHDSIHQLELNVVPGIYFIELSSQGEQQQYKLVKI